MREAGGEREREVDHRKARSLREPVSPPWLEFMANLDHDRRDGYFPILINVHRPNAQQ